MMRIVVVSALLAAVMSSSVAGQTRSLFQPPTVIHSASEREPLRQTERSLVPATTRPVLARQTAPSSKKRNALIGLGIGAAAALLFVAVTCENSSEQSDCYGAGTAWFLPAGAAGGAALGAVLTN